MNQQAQDENNLEANKRTKGLDEKFCESCGEVIKIKAEICPKCGVRVGKNVSKTALLLLTFFFGGIGIHKFYLRKYLQGILYILFFWTGIPALIALIEFIVYAFTSSEKLQEKYTASGSVAVIAIAGFIGFIFIFGILAAISIPQFAAYRTRSYNVAAHADLRNAATAQEAYRVDNNKYAVSIDKLTGNTYGLYLSEGVKVNIQYANDNQYVIVAFHEKGDRKYILKGPGGEIQMESKQ
ncbi:NINE protein [Thermodesulfobacteriota bacterium]